MAQLVKNLSAMWETWVQSLGLEDPLEKRIAMHSVFWPGEYHGLYSPWGHKELDMTEQLYFFILGGSDSKVSVYNEGDPGSIPGSGRSPGEGNGNPHQYYCLENPMDRGAL